MKSPSETSEDRIPLPGGWPSIAEQREYWKKREQAEYQLLQMLEKKLNELENSFLLLMDDVEKLRKLLKENQD